MFEAKEERSVVITVTGKAAEELLAIGAKDLRDFFLPQYLHIPSEDSEIKENR
ncbi:hypothetical protein PKG28_002863 [Listeria innocua]|nr:hypothetical protein [Listeria innocua]